MNPKGVDKFKHNKSSLQRKIELGPEIQEETVVLQESPQKGHSSRKRFKDLEKERIEEETKSLTTSRRLRVGFSVATFLFMLAYICVY